MTHATNLLVVVDPTDTEGHPVQEAAAHAAGTGTGLVVLSVMTYDDYRARARAVNGIRQLNFEYTYDHAVEASRHVALRITDAVLADSDIPFEVIGFVGTPVEAVHTVAEEYDCDHVVVTGHRRSIWDIIRGVPDLATTIEKTFPGNVTVFFDHLRDEPLAPPTIVGPNVPHKPA
ncbi:universal stress protein [Haladaptatus sp. DFWS20]|uniref:universal stress protein n=1 Tax=Haladaptatus sp. DFWS20 TaxID=3403467 RepID=UPI003EBEB95D